MVFHARQHHENGSGSRPRSLPDQPSLEARPDVADSAADLPLHGPRIAAVHAYIAEQDRIARQSFRHDAHCAAQASNWSRRNPRIGCTVPKSAPINEDTGPPLATG